MEKKPAVCGRFAPAPAADAPGQPVVLFASPGWLPGARGRMVLRLEDLDPDRCTQAWCDQVMRDLEWLGPRLGQ